MRVRNIHALLLFVVILSASVASADPDFRSLRRKKGNSKATPGKKMKSSARKKARSKASSEENNGRKGASDNPPNNSDCPDESPAILSEIERVCTNEEQKCSFAYDSTIPGGICQSKDDCTCIDGNWNCSWTIGCVSDNPPYIIACPSESPFASKETTCDDQHQDSPCTFEYSSTIDGSQCEHKDECTCANGEWDCAPTIVCR